MNRSALDEGLRAELLEEGVLFDGYHPRMAEVHHRNATRLSEIFDLLGWPTRALVGDDGSHAAWLVLQHSIGDPAVMRCGLALLQSSEFAVEVDQVQRAMLEDRIRVFSWLPQRYGTQFDWDDDGVMNPRPIDDAGGCGRAAVGCRASAARRKVARGTSGRRSIWRDDA